MFALQSAAPSLGPPLVVLTLLLVGGVVLGAVSSAIVRRLSNPVGKYRLLYVGVLFPFALLAYGVLALLEFGDAVVAATLGGTGGVVATLLADFVGMLAAGCVGLLAYAPTIRGVRAVRDVDLSTGRTFVRMARYVVGLCAVVTVLVAPLRLGPGVSPLALVGLFAVALSALLVGSPWLLTSLRSTITPDEATRDRLATLRERAGLDVRDVRVFDTDNEETATVHVRGPPGYRRLFVTTTVLDRFDDGTAAALFAVQAGRVRRHLLLRRAGTAILATAPLVAAVTGLEPRWLFLGAAVAVVLVGFWACRCAVRAADDDAAARVGPDAVADALERYAAVHAMEPIRRRVPNPLSVNVALGDRIDRLRGR
ncbi:peptidase [Haloplanus litoreus]|uniref:Peptidase n=1 Tax=Haloplanus litoreus TaxID=767515 RepID=A0ABD5ZUF1_9EURY